jgi:hypothetical protein
MLEFWNTGKMGFGIMGEWFIGKTHFDYGNKKPTESLQLNQYSIFPSFHHSMFPIKYAKLAIILDYSNVV